MLAHTGQSQTMHQGEGKGGSHRHEGNEGSCLWDNFYKFQYFHFLGKHLAVRPRVDFIWFSSPAFKAPPALSANKCHQPALREIPYLDAE